MEIKLTQDQINELMRLENAIKTAQIVHADFLKVITGSDGPYNLETVIDFPDATAPAPDGPYNLGTVIDFPDATAPAPEAPNV